MTRNVKGVLFADYVRMVRSNKHVNWSKHLLEEDFNYLRVKIDPSEWYPMAMFERLGNAILSELAGGDMAAARIWGRLSVDQLSAAYPTLVAKGDPIETLSRFRVLRSTFFDFEALEIPLLLEELAEVVIRYHMGRTAEEAASYQTMGFFERLIEHSGGTNVQASFAQRCWEGDPRTLLELAWRMG